MGDDRNTQPIEEGIHFAENIFDEEQEQSRTSTLAELNYTDRRPSQESVEFEDKFDEFTDSNSSSMRNSSNSMQEAVKGSKEKERKGSKLRLFSRFARRKSKAKASDDEHASETEYETISPHIQVPPEVNLGSIKENEVFSMANQFERFFSSSKSGSGHSSADDNRGLWTAPDSWAVAVPFNEASSKSELPSIPPVMTSQASNMTTISTSALSSITERSNSLAPSLKRNSSESQGTIALPFELKSDDTQLWAIRVFKPVTRRESTKASSSTLGFTFVTLSCPLYITASELCHQLGKKFFIQDAEKFNLYVIHSDLERMLRPDDYPLVLQKKWLQEVGYTHADQISKLGREDNSYLCKFIYSDLPSQKPPPSDLLEQLSMDPSNPLCLDSSCALLVGQNLYMLPVILFRYAATLESLDLSKNIMINLPIDFFESCLSLKSLRLAGNFYEACPPAILLLKQLTHLDLSFNKLQENAIEPLIQLKTITHLYLDSNYLQNLPESFCALQNLRTLSLSNNYFSSVPNVIFSLTGLNELDLSFNLLEELSGRISLLSKLKTLVLAGNLLTLLPQELVLLYNLAVIDIRGNSITDLSMLCVLKKLTKLHANYNSIAVLSPIALPSITELKLSQNALVSIQFADVMMNIKTLNLSGCKLSSFPSNAFAMLVNVEKVDLCDNHLTALPPLLVKEGSHLTGCLKIIKFCANNNKLDCLPEGIEHSETLQILSCYGNNIKKISPLLWECKTLRVLNISSNLICNLPLPSDALITEFNKSLTGSSRFSRDATFPLPGLMNSLEELYMGENRCNNDIVDSLKFLPNLKVLNLSYNSIVDIGNGFTGLTCLQELYISGNQLSSIPDEIDKMKQLKYLYINCNRLSNIPAELANNNQLTVFEASTNNLKYNITNWPYDWNWNWNTELEILNLSGNKKLEIRPGSRLDNGLDLSSFTALHKLRLLNVSDVKTLTAVLPEETFDRRIKVLKSEVDILPFGIAESLGTESEIFNIWDFIIPKYLGREKEYLCGLFDGKHSGAIAKFLYESFSFTFSTELRKMKREEDISCALRRTFLNLNKDIGSLNIDSKNGSSGIVAYLHDSELHIANVGDSIGVLCRNGISLCVASKHHPWNRSELQRIRSAGGFVTADARVLGEYKFTRAFGCFHLLPYVNADPSIHVIELTESDEFLIMATGELWEYMNYQTAVDIARTEIHDLDFAAKKVRDYALFYGAKESLMVTILGLKGKVERKRKPVNRDSVIDTVRIDLIYRLWLDWDQKFHLPMDSLLLSLLTLEIQHGYGRLILFQ